MDFLFMSFLMLIVAGVVVFVGCAIKTALEIVTGQHSK